MIQCFLTFLVKQPAHNGFIVGKQASAAVLACHAPVREIVVLLDIQYQESADFLVRQATVPVKPVKFR